MLKVEHKLEVHVLQAGDCIVLWCA